MHPLHFTLHREGILARDRDVMTFCRRRLQAPVAWFLSGGYQRGNAALIAERWARGRPGDGGGGGS